ANSRIFCEVKSNVSYRRIFSVSNCDMLVNRLLNDCLFSSQHCAKSCVDFSVFKLAFDNHFRNAFPLSKVSSNRKFCKKSPWITPEILIASNKLKDLHRITQDYPHVPHLRRYTTAHKNENSNCQLKILKLRTMII